MPVSNYRQFSYRKQSSQKVLRLRLLLAAGTAYLADLALLYLGDYSLRGTPGLWRTPNRIDAQASLSTTVLVSGIVALRLPY